MEWGDCYEVMKEASKMFKSKNRYGIPRPNKSRRISWSKLTPFRDVIPTRPLHFHFKQTSRVQPALNFEEAKNTSILYSVRSIPPGSWSPSTSASEYAPVLAVDG